MTRRAASLTSSLMARKGAAGPSRLEQEEAAHKNGRPAPRLVASTPHVPKKSAPAKTRHAKTTKAQTPVGEAAADKRRFTLRLSEDQHIRMRLASVHLHMSAQQMVMKALDQYLAETVPHIRGGDCACMEAGKDGCFSSPDNEKGTK
jgi:hypothetical protein